MWYYGSQKEDTVIEDVSG